MNFFTTQWCILTIFCLEYKFQLLQILVLCTVVNFTHYYKFQVLHDFFHVIMVQFKIFLGVATIADFSRYLVRHLFWCMVWIQLFHFFFITPWCILTIFCLEYKFQLLQILVVCTVATFVHYYKFQVLHDFFHVIIVQFEIFLGVAISAVFCKITCRIWILMHSMNPAILV